LIPTDAESKALCGLYKAIPLRISSSSNRPTVVPEVIDFTGRNGSG